MTRRISLLLFVLTCLLGWSEAQAGFGIGIEPIIGYENIQQVLPTAHRVSRLVYGGRITLGIPLISIETEYTRGVSEEAFSAMSQTSTADKLKAGLRSGFGLGPISLHIRGGLQAKQERIDQTTAGVTSTTYQPLVYDPYGGAGIRFRLSSKLSASADVVAVIPNITDMTQNEYQMTAGFAIRLP